MATAATTTNLAEPTTTDLTNITLIGAGTIGLSFAALHLSKNPSSHLTIYDPRPDLTTHISTHLPSYLPPSLSTTYLTRLTLTSSFPLAVSNAHIIQEQGPETPAFKTSIWPQIEAHAPADALFWSSTSGIPASAQAVHMRDPSRLLVVHPYNPPHVMPLLELVPSPQTGPAEISRTQAYWRALGRTPVLIRKECAGFVANRLAFALFREACGLVAQGVVDVKDLDAIVEASMGPRWAVAGPFKSYHAGGGEGGLSGFMEKIGGTVRTCWEAGEEGRVVVGGEWQAEVCRQAEEAYGVVDVGERDEKTKRVLDAVGRG